MFPILSTGTEPLFDDFSDVPYCKSYVNEATVVHSHESGTSNGTCS